MALTTRRWTSIPSVEGGFAHAGHRIFDTAVGCDRITGVRGNLLVAGTGKLCAAPPRKAGRGLTA